jgi:hypothetical protein
MITKTSFVLATLAVSLTGALALSSPARAVQLAAMSQAYCAPGYQADAGGNCQAINGIVDNRCPQGLEPHVAFNGDDFVCVPYGQGD